MEKEEVDDKARGQNECTSMTNFNKLKLKARTVTINRINRVHASCGSGEPLTEQTPAAARAFLRDTLKVPTCNGP